MTNDDDDTKASDSEINRKRKSNQECQVAGKLQEEVDLFDLSLDLRVPSRQTRTRPSLSDWPPPASTHQQQPEEPLPQMRFLQQSLYRQNPSQHPLQLSPSHPLFTTHSFVPEPSNSSSSPIPIPTAGGQETVVTIPVPARRPRRNPNQAPREGKSDTVPAPFPWATTHRATVHSLNDLISKQVLKITGEVQCKRCERQYEMEYDLREKFLEVGTFIAQSKSSMHDRAPAVWMNPELPNCRFCGQESTVKPVIAVKKKEINWLFLLLGQMLGCCTLEQLKYFCKHTKNHRTGAKDRVLYLTYLGLCKQLDPSGPFDR